MDPLQQATEDEPTLDITAAVDEIAEGVGLSPPADEPETPAAAPAEPAAPTGDQPAAPAAAAAPAEPAPAEAPVETPAPHTWRKEAQAEWAKVPPVVREELVKREADIQRFVDQAKPQMAIGNQFQQILQPYMKQFADANINVFENYKATLEVQRALAFGSPQEKLEIIQTLAQNAGIQLDGTQLAVPEGAYQQHVAGLEARIGQLEGGVRQVSSNVYEARVAELSQSVLAFMQDTEKHPYAVDLSDDMNRLIEKGLASNLEEAYAQAVNASPVFRQKAYEAEVAKRLSAQAAADSERAEAARKAAAANVRSNGSRRAPQPEESLDDTLSNTLASINARVH